MSYRIELLGGLRVSAKGQSCHRLQTRKAGSLLAYLAYHPGHAHSRDTLTELLWPEADPEAGRQNLRQALFSIRRQFETGDGVPPLILADRCALQINGPSVNTDVGAFRHALRHARQAPDAAARQRHLLDALHLYQGELLPGLEEDWVLPERAALLDEYVRAVLQAVVSAEELGAPESMIEPLRRAIGMDPCREELNYHLLRALQRAGRAQDALDHLLVFERKLREFGATPSVRIYELRDSLRRELRSPSGSQQSACSKKGVEQRLLPQGTLTLVMLQVRQDENWTAALDCSREALAERGGVEMFASGAAVCAGFDRASAACEAAGKCWSSASTQGAPARSVKAALHTAELAGLQDATTGSAFAEIAALLECAHWGQILCSSSTAGLLEHDHKTAGSLRVLGEYRLRRGGGGLRVYQIDNSALPGAQFPPPKAEAVGADSLPASVTRFFGREREREQLSDLIRGRQTRLATLTGPGGSGKTRLAVEVGREAGGLLGGAVWFVPLADLTEPQAIPSAILEVLGAPSRANTEPLALVVEHLATQRCLLVLDNIEHLIGGQCAGEVERLVQTLLGRCPSLMCVVTSRQRLDLDGEVELPVLPLPTPSIAVGETAAPRELACIPSVELFVDRARSARPDFRLTGRNAPAVARLCRDLEGIPLAIELAAARATVLTPEQMVAELQDRFQFLASRRRSLPERHRTAWAAVQWSYRLLPEPQKRFFTALSVFRGGWTLEAAAAVAGEPQAVQFLDDLRAASLVQVEESVGGMMRFRMLETLRQFGWEVLPSETRSDLRRRHAAFYLELAREADRQRLSTAPPPGERIAAEHQNFRAALAELLDAEPEAVLELATRLSWFWEGQGYVPEALSWLRRALAGTEAPGVGQARALCAVGRLCFWQGDLHSAREALQESARLAGELDLPDVLAEALTRLGMVTIYLAEYDAGRDLLEKGLAVCEATGDEPGKALPLLQLGILGNCTCDWELSTTSLRACVRAAQSAGDQRTEGLALFFLGDAALSRADFEAAGPPLRESLAVGATLHDETVLTHALWGLAILGVEVRDLDAARAALEELVPYARKLGSWTHPFVLEVYGYLATACGRLSDGALLLAAAAATRERSSMPLTASYEPRHQRYLSLIHHGLSPGQVEEAWSRGTEMAPEIAIERAVQAHR